MMILFTLIHGTGIVIPIVTPAIGSGDNHPTLL
jgi:hypothetical protein